jgi:Cof subfamily protein (haloacid dehalogenase superfamily)
VRDKVAVRKDGAVTPASEPAESSDARPSDPAPDQEHPAQHDRGHRHAYDHESEYQHQHESKPDERHDEEHDERHDGQDEHDHHTYEETFAEPAPRLIATDLDGTLLRDDKTVSQRTIAALAAAEDAGVEVFFVTGRPVRWMGVVAEHLAGHGMAIVANGAAVYDLRTGTLIEAFPLPEDDALTVAHALREAVPGTAFAVERPFGFRREPAYPPAESDSFEPRATIDALLAADRGQPLLKLLAKHPSLDPDAFLATALSIADGHVEVTRSSESALLEISGAGVSKATTLAKCCAERGVTAAEVVAFGDMPNDVAMLDWAGTSYAVANAHPHVLAATTHRAESNDDDGVARVIERILAARRRQDLARGTS